MFFFELFKCISMSIRYVLFQYNTLFKLESIKFSFWSEESFFIKLIVVDNYPVIKLEPII